jgi:glucose/arabinose dehydrogenase
MTATTRRGALAFAAGGALSACASPSLAQVEGREVRSQKHAFRLAVVTRGLDHPWALAFLPDGSMLITERPGRVRILRDGRLSPPLAGVPEVVARGQGGLLDACLHPDFAANRVVYLSFAGAAEGGTLTVIARARLDGDRLVDARRIFSALPAQSGNNHFGCRMAFGRDGRLYATTGERFARDRAQALDDLAGKIVRLDDDGGVPADNPFVGRAGARAEIWSWGHRNAQGLAVHPATGALWAHEHGARGGDEVNLIRRGANYGWPRTTHGVDYSGAIISPHKSLPGIEDPLWVWTPSIAPSGMAFVVGDAFPAWRGDLFVGALAGQVLVRLELDGERVVREERMLERAVGRIRDVRCAPDGRIWLLTDENDGALIRLDPA